MYNKVSHTKTLLEKADEILNTHDLRMKSQELFNIPESDLEYYIPFYEINDEDDPCTQFEHHLFESISRFYNHHFLNFSFYSQVLYSMERIGKQTDIQGHRIFLSKLLCLMH